MLRLSQFIKTLLLATSFLLLTACGDSGKTQTNSVSETNTAVQTTTTVVLTESNGTTGENPTNTNESTTTNGGSSSTADTTKTDGNENNISNSVTVTVTLTSLNLTLDKTLLNKDESTSLKVIATYRDGTSKEVTDKVEWAMIPKESVSISNNTLKALKDTQVSLQAKLNEKLSEKVNLDIAWIVNGHTLPPQPDKSINDSTLLGVDVNGNNVRDDVERWIYETYKNKHPIHIDIAMQAGRAYKLVLETPERAKEIYPILDATTWCESYYMIYAKYFNEPLLVKEDVDTEYFRKKIYFNTKERIDTYIQYDILLSGNTYSTPAVDKNMTSYCDFNTSKYDE